MAVLDNHCWQYAQAGKTLIRLSGRGKMQMLFSLALFAFNCKFNQKEIYAGILIFLAF